MSPIPNISRMSCAPNISRYITYAEATASETATRQGLDNTPSTLTLVNMRLVAERCFEPARARFGLPLGVTSFYRSPAVNKAVKGSRSSQHCLGQAIDIDTDKYSNEVLSNSELFHWIKDNLDFDQLIWEYGDDTNPAWVHVSYRSVTNNRNQVLRILRRGGKTITLPHS